MADRLITVREELTKEWWDRWWEADYSWGGLSSKRWRGWYISPSGILSKENPGRLRKNARPATLQDFWRAEQAKLIVGPDGRNWTRAHAPEYWKDGSPAKSTWSQDELSEIEGAIDRALESLPEAAFEDSTPSLITPRVRNSPTALTRIYRLARTWPIALDGVVFHSIPAQIANHDFIQARHAFFADLVTLSPNITVDMRRCFFREGLYSDGEMRDVRLTECIFLEDVDLSESSFQSLNLSRSNLFGQSEFENVKVKERAEFTHIVLHCGANFRRLQASEFRGQHLHSSAGLDLSDSHVGQILLNSFVSAGEVDLSGVRMQKLDCSDGSFEAGANLERSTTSENLNCKNTRWKKSADFSSCTLSNANFSNGLIPTFDALALRRR